MKRYLVGLLLLAGTLGLAGQAAAVSYGIPDTLHDASFLPNSGDAMELNWLNANLNPDVDSFTKYVPAADPANPTHVVYDFGDVSGWNFAGTVDGVDSYAHALPVPADYFFFKTGAKRGRSNHFLFQNNGDENWAVISLADVQADNFERISHAGTVGGDGTPVPEPGAMVLLGSGLLGLVGFARRRREA
ncbi:MAG: PEP-CTERM sorting domain-containing protein [Deltaproteobacteria bacterium]|nr:PEP-CTERM sorting domain-containing protein [Deltaproteobacteria bacterium]